MFKKNKKSCLLAFFRRLRTPAGGGLRNFSAEKYPCSEKMQASKKFFLKIVIPRQTLLCQANQYCILDFMNDEQIIEPIAQNEKKPSGLMSLLKEVLIFAVIAFCIILPFRAFVAEPYIVSGASMDPTFATGHYLIVDKISHELGAQLQRNSVVIFQFPKSANIPSEDGKNLIKRVIGLPGDTVIETGNTVTIKNASNPDGFVLDQSYVTHPLPGSFAITLKPGEYFVMGDNRAESFDSRSWGVLPSSDVIGRPILRLWPLSEIGVLPGQDNTK